MMGGSREKRSNNQKGDQKQSKNERNKIEDENLLGHKFEEMSQEDFDGQMLSMISKQNSSQLMKENVIQSNTEFMNLDNLPDIIQKLSTRLCKPEDILINRGTESDCIYFLSKGIIEIYIDDPR